MAHLHILVFLFFSFGAVISELDFLHDFHKQRDNTVEFFQHIIRTNETYEVSEVPVYEGRTPGSFGYAVVFDHKLTRGSDYFSPEIGRLRGLAVVSSVDGSQAHETFTIGFTGRVGEISCVGSFDFRQPVSRVPVIGGSGEFYRFNGVYTSQVVQTEGFNLIAHVQLNLRSND